MLKKIENTSPPCFCHHICNFLPKFTCSFKQSLIRQTIDLVNPDICTQPTIDPAFDIVLSDEDDADIGFSISK